MTEVHNTSFLSSLFKKLSDAIKVQKETGINTTPLQDEARRQMRQIKDDPIKGQGVTKSGEDG